MFAHTEYMLIFYKVTFSNLYETPHNKNIKYNCRRINGIVYYYGNFLANNMPIVTMDLMRDSL